MTIVVAHNVTQSLLKYYNELRENPKYKITWERAWEKYSNFHKYVYGGIVNDLPKGRFCPYTSLGQRYNANRQAKYPSLKYIAYYDESKYKWYIAYILNDKKGTITVTRIKGASIPRPPE